MLKELFSRRSTLQAGIGAAFGSMLGNSASPHVGDPGAYAEANFPSGSELVSQAPQNPRPPLMQYDIAWLKVIADPLLKKQARAQLYAYHRKVEYIDPDIMTLKAISNMAKITLQRQRNVERMLEAAFAPITGDMRSSPVFSIATEMIERQVKQLMWGKEDANKLR